MIGLLMLAAIWFIPRSVEQNAVERATASARQTIGIFRTLRAYYTESVISRLVPSGRAKAAVDYHNVGGGIPLPATFIYDMSARLEKEDTRIRLYSAYPFPNRKDRTLDPFQEEAAAGGGGRRRRFRQYPRHPSGGRAEQHGDLGISRGDALTRRQCAAAAPGYRTLPDATSGRLSFLRR